MGKLFDNAGLTNTALADPSGQTDWFDPSQVRSGQALRSLVKSQEGQIQPATANLPNTLTAPGETPTNSPTTYSQADPNLSRLVKPSFLQAASMGAPAPGMVNAASPALSKAGKLAVFLRSGLEGALAGRAADEQAVAASGGHRSGGAGSGFQAAQYLPWLRASQQQAVERGGLENQVLKNQVQYAPQLNFLKVLQGQSEVNKNTAEAGKFNAEALAAPIKAKLEQAQTEAANYKEDPNLGLIDLRTKQPVNPSALAPLTAEEAQVLGKQPGDRVPLKLKNTASEIAVRGLTTVNTEEGVFERNRNTGSMTRLGSNPRMTFAPSNRIIEVADPDNPGQTKFMTAGSAVASGAAGKSSASLLVPRKVLEWATSGKGGEEINAFNTALAHADLLKKAATALGNGDVRTLNSLKNKFKSEFGNPNLTNFNAIANAYTHEIQKMLSSGHITDSEIGTAGATMPSNANLETILDVLDSYSSLAASKMTQRYNQFTQGMQGKPNFPAGTGNAAGSRPPLSSFEKK